jgi:hypothetical protein
MAVDQPSNASPDSVVPPDVSGTPAGIPTASTSNVGAPAQQPQPAALPPESVGQGIRRGMRGTQFVVDSAGNLTDARTTAPSGKGEFGSILGGIVMGALAGASKSRMGRTPSAEVGGGAGASVGAAIEAGQQRDATNRQQAQTQFATKQSARKMSREQAESAMRIGMYAAQTASEVDANKRANDEHPLIMKSKELGLQESGLIRTCLSVK